MNLNDNQFKPKLSRHELILDRYKTILKSNNTYSNEVLNNKDKEKTNHNAYLNNILPIQYKESKIENKVNNLIDNSEIRTFLKEKNNYSNNSVVSSSATKQFALNKNLVLTSSIKKNNQIDEIEMIKAKYSLNNNSNINNINNNSNSFNQKEISHAFIQHGNLQNKDNYFATNSFSENLFTKIIDNNSKNTEIEFIKSKYSNNSISVINTTTNEINKSSTSNENNTKLEDILAKYKNPEVKSASFLNNSFIVKEKENGQSHSNNNSNISNVTNNPQPDSELISRIHTLEEKVTQIGSLNIQKSEKLSEKEGLINKIKEIANNSLEKYQEKVSFSDINNSQCLESSMKHLKHLKEQNYHKRIKHIKNEEATPTQMINQILENVTSKLFLPQNNNIQTAEKEDQIKLMPKKAKVFKLRTSIQKNVNRKIQTFEEFINSDSESK
jgi:hypothetical protein